ncbi:MAG: formylglycine-generating enzyme family protein [Oligosphaeraceae bacterium]
MVDDQEALSPLEAAVQGVQASCKVMAAAAERGDHEQLLDATVQVIGRAAGVLQVARAGGRDGAEPRQETALVPVVAETVEADDGPRSFQLSPKVSLELLPVPGEGCYLGRFPVTQEQYMAVTKTNPSCFKGKRRPVESICWDEAIAFCDKLTEKYGGTFTLPKEDVWEKARMAGDKNTPDVDFREAFMKEARRTSYSTSTFSSVMCAAIASASIPKNEENDYKTFEVDEAEPNAWGFCDVGENVWEWCADDYVVWDDDQERVLSYLFDYFDYEEETTLVDKPIRYGNTARFGFREDKNAENVGFRVCWWPNGKPEEKEYFKEDEKESKKSPRRRRKEANENGSSRQVGSLVSGLLFGTRY